MPLKKKLGGVKSKGKGKTTTTSISSDSNSISKAKKAISCLRWVPRVGSHLPDTDHAGARHHPALTTAAAEDEDEAMVVEAGGAQEAVSAMETTGNDEDADSQDSEQEMALKESDYVFICGTANEVKAQYSLELVVYDSDKDIQFLKHDLVLSKPPLDLTWMDFTPQGDRGSFAVVSSLLPFIEIFDLTRKKDCRAALTLGGCEDEELNFEELNPDELKRSLKPGSHSDAILCVDWNVNQRNILASGSADRTVKLWDLTEGKCAETLTHHTSEVLQLEWHPTNRFHLLTAGLNDQAVVLSQVNKKNEQMVWKIGCRPDTVAWHPQQEHCFFVGTSEGEVRIYETRMHAPLSTFKAHPGHDVSCLEMNRHLPGLLATGSNDRSIALWDLRTLSSETKAKLICKETLGVGEVYCLSFNPNNPLLLAAGGSSAKQLVWTLTSALEAYQFPLPEGIRASSSSATSSAAARASHK